MKHIFNLNPLYSVRETLLGKHIIKTFKIHSHNNIDNMYVLYTIKYMQ